MSRVIPLLFLDHRTRRVWGVSVTSWPFFTPGKYPVPIVQEAGWAPGPVWTSAENLVLTGIRSPDRPARSQSLYRLSYSANTNMSSAVTIYMCSGLCLRHFPCTWYVFPQNSCSLYSKHVHRISTKVGQTAIEWPQRAKLTLRLKSSDNKTNQMH